MKIRNKILLAAVALTGLTFNACDDGNAVVDEVFDTTTRGVVLRTVNIVSNELPIGQDDSFFGVDLELQDIEDGELVENVEVYVAFRDLTVEEGAPDLDKAEVLVETVPKSEFTIGEYGFPRFSYSLTLPEMLNTLSLADSDIDGGDQFTVRFEVVMVDGRRFSVADNTDTSTGSFFASPFLYPSNVVCPPTTPTPGDWTISLQDSYGDGWNGASLLVTVDGVGTNYSIETGAEGTATFTIPEGAEVLSIIYVSGDWDSEVTFQVSRPDSVTILDLGPSPLAGVELLNYCLNNL